MKHPRMILTTLSHLDPPPTPKGNLRQRKLLRPRNARPILILFQPRKNPRPRRPATQLARIIFLSVSYHGTWMRTGWRGSLEAMENFPVWESLLIRRPVAPKGLQANRLFLFRHPLTASQIRIRWVRQLSRRHQGAKGFAWNIYWQSRHQCGLLYSSLRRRSWWGWR